MKMRDRNYCILALFAVVAMGSTGCSSLSNTGNGALIGGGAGAGLGAAIGSASGHTGAGALIGGITGAAAGGLIGNDMDQKEKKTEQAKLAQAQAAANAKPPLTVEDVRQLVASGTPDDVIINQIRTTGSTYKLTAADIQYLTQNGVSNRVIMEMQNAKQVTVVTQQPVIVRQAPPPDVVYVQQPVYVAPPPPPPPAASFRFTYIR
ncbi:hypothetical protein KIH39_18755 [Telmatocola sphagniphila]|uniref:Glycine zipper domain-containing protein n=1 Tax=Telmatocola sphagniphila TaxID=1123043 RepID=A0A8E6EU69_9BACT|nr:glycine zipper domain-containing protein [Telmatocola sphagniphila]QVL30877.1 hypothetical protein KIH39_18755 [Telmatocola sphagniphila]